MRGGVAGSGTYALNVVDNRTSGIKRAVGGEAGPTHGTLAVFLAANDPLNFGVNGTVSDPNGPGVMGQRGSASLQPTRHYGVAGYAQNDTDGIGVYGEGAAYGVLGTANTTAPAQGRALGCSVNRTPAWACRAARIGNVGVLGTSSASHGVYGSSINGYGLYATSTNSTGIVASTNGGNAIQGASNGNVGVLGTSNSSIGGFFASGTATGLYADRAAAGFAARFDGPVLVNGHFTVIGGPKSAAVPHPDGSHRRLYCVESPESWFEDFGGPVGERAGSRAARPDFAAGSRGAGSRSPRGARCRAVPARADRGAGGVPRPRVARLVAERPPGGVEGLPLSKERPHAASGESRRRADGTEQRGHQPRRWCADAGAPQQAVTEEVE